MTGLHRHRSMTRMTHRTQVSLIAVLALISGPWSVRAQGTSPGPEPGAGHEPNAPIEFSKLGYLHVYAPRVEVPIPERRAPLRPYARKPLIAEDDNCYFVAQPGELIAAYPKRNRKGESTAWVGESLLVFFVGAVNSREATLSLPQDTELPILQTRSNAYLVAVAPRNRHAGTVWLPRDTPGITLRRLSRLEEYHKRQEALRLAAERERLRRERLRAHEGRNTATKQRPAPPVKPPVIRTTRTTTLSLPSVPEPPDDDDGRWNMNGDSKRDMPILDILKKVSQKWGGQAIAWAREFWILLAAGLGTLLIVIVAIIVIVKLIRRAARRPKKPASIPAAPQPNAAAQTTDAQLFEKIGSDKMLGTLASLPIVDLIQFLNLSRQSGLLLVGEEDSPLATLTFAEGEITSASCRGKHGDDGVFSTLREKQGVFVFTKGPFQPENQQSMVKAKTSSLLMEGCRRLDEVPEDEPPRKRKFKLSQLGKK